MSLHRRSLIVVAVDLGSAALSLALDAEHAIRRTVRARRQRAADIEAAMRRHPAGGRATPPPAAPDVDDHVDPDDLEYDVDKLTVGEQAELDQIACWARQVFNIHPIAVTAEVTALEHQYGPHPLWDQILREHEEGAR